MIHAWLKAARLPSQSYIFLPLLLGQALGADAGKSIDTFNFAVVHGFGLFIQLYIVFANDYADVETDRNNTTFTPFSGGSRVLVDGDLTRSQLGKAAVLTAGASVFAGAILSFRNASLLPLALALCGLLLVWLYSYPPARLSYRGGGEFLQMIGVGVVLPLMGFVSQGGALRAFPWEVLAFILPTQLACAMGTALPDEPSDTMDHKRTVPVLLGKGASRMLLVLLHVLTVVLLLQAHWNDVGPWVACACFSLLGMVSFCTSKPGTRGMTALVFFSVLTTLANMAALTVLHWKAGIL